MGDHEMIFNGRGARLAVYIIELQDFWLIELLDFWSLLLFLVRHITNFTIEVYKLMCN